MSRCLGRGGGLGRRGDLSAGLGRPVRPRNADPDGLWDVLFSVRLATPVENLLTTVVLSFSMSADAFAAALGKGAALDRPRFSEALRAGLVFGVVETITPVMGWAAGLAASGYITAIDHWVAFALLVAIGAKMIWESAHRPEA